MYAKWLKRTMDIILSFCALIVLLPLLLILCVIGSMVMKGNPFFVQKRPGKDEKIISLIKFRTMTNQTDEAGRLLPDSQRLVPYGRFLRASSLDELPSLWNILVGDLSIVGPRPLLVEYLPWYTDAERQRHSVRPGLTGWAQIHGRNSVDWDKRLALDLEYVAHISFWMDLKILLLTVKQVLVGHDVSEDTRVTEGNLADIRRARWETETTLNL